MLKCSCSILFALSGWYMLTKVPDSDPCKLSHVLCFEVQSSVVQLLQEPDRQSRPLQFNPQYHRSQRIILRQLIPRFSRLQCISPGCSSSFQHLPGIPLVTFCVTFCITFSGSWQYAQRWKLPHQPRHQCVCQCAGGSVLPAGPSCRPFPHTSAATATQGESTPLLL